MANQIVVSAGAKVRNLSGVLTATSGVVSFLPIDVSLGIPQLDVNGKILVSQLPNSVMEYKGTWNISTNTPTLVNGTGNQGDVYLVEGAAVGGTSFNFGAGAILFFNGDQAIYSGSIWQRASGATGTVTSVAVTESGDSLNITGSPITTSGTINIGFNGTNLQYVNGAGNLTTFPILTGYVPYTGATQDVDLGAFKLNAQSLHIKGTAGNGHLGLKHQSASATASANEVSLFADSLGDLGWLNGNLYLSKFITSGNTAARSYTFPNATCNIPDDSLVVHLAGTETITGAKTFSAALVGTTAAFSDLGNSANTNLISLLQPNLTVSNGPVLTLGKAISINNAASIQFNYVSAGSSTNSLTLALYGSSGLQIYGNGNAVFAASLTIGTTLSNGTYTYTLPSATGTLALTSQLTSGTVTSVAALTLGTTGTDLSSTVANSTTTPVITLNVPTASASNRGALSSADWSTFNSKQGTITLTTTGTSGAATFSSNTLNIPQYQGVLTNPVTGTGTTNYLPKFTGASTIGDSLISESSGVITLGTGQINLGTSGSIIYMFPAFSANLNLLQSYNPTTSVYTTEEHRASDYSFKIGTTTGLILNASGNLGLGVTPSAWSQITAIELSNGVSFGAYSAAAAPNMYITSNAYYNGTNWIYKLSSYAPTLYVQNSLGNYVWHTASTGTAGATITLTAAMTFFNTGNLVIGTNTDAGYKLDVNGTGRFVGALSGTSATFTSGTTGPSTGITSIGDITTARTSTTGAIFLGTTGSKYLYYDGTKYLLNASPLEVGGSVTATSYNRAAAGTGFLNGKYAGAETTATTGPIYCIGDSYTPTSTSLNTMYGIGYSYNNFTGKYGPADTWGMYVAGGGTANVFLTADGRGFFSSTITASGFFESSDSRLKTLIEDNYQTKGIASITPKLYTKNEKVELGYYAQDFVGILDSAVSKGSDDMLSLSYREVLVAKVYALEQRIKELENK